MADPDPSQPVLVTGASGFVGRHVVRALLAEGFSVRVLVRRPGRMSAADGRVAEAVGSVTEGVALTPAAAGCAAVVHLVGIIAERGTQTYERVHVEGTRSALAAAQAAGIRRFVHMSACGTRAHAVSRYHQTKWQAEELVRGSGLDWTIFRPSLIHGPDGEFAQMLRAWAFGRQPPFLFMPYFGPGFLGQRATAQLQPVFVDDVAEVFARAPDTPDSIGRAYDVVGPDRYTWPEMLHLASSILRGKPKRAVGIPAWKALLLARLPIPLPFNREQVLMALEDNTGDPAPLLHDFAGLTLHALGPTMAAYRAEMGPAA